MLAIKLKLVGRKNQRSFRVIVQEARSKLGGKFVEDLGWYNPHTNQFRINKDRADYWVKSGAQPTVRVARILEVSKVSGEVENYETREGRKKNKGQKAKEGEVVATSEGNEETQRVVTEAKTVEDGSPDTDASKTEEDTKAEEPKDESSPTEDAESRDGAEEEKQK